MYTNDKVKPNTQTANRSLENDLHVFLQDVIPVWSSTLYSIDVHLQLVLRTGSYSYCYRYLQVHRIQRVRRPNKRCEFRI